MRHNPLVLALDLGATRCRLAVVNTDRHVVKKITLPTYADYGQKQCLDRLSNAALCLTHGLKNRILGIGISVASPVDSDTGVLNNPPNLPGWDGFDILFGLFLL